MTTLDLSHPRPRLRRDRFTSLDGEWQFATDPSNVGLQQGWHRGDWSSVEATTIIVPFAPQSPASGITDFDGSDVVWYSREVQLPADASADEALALHFGAVDHSCDVWIDGDHVTSHIGGYTPFRADISRLVSDGQPHRLVVRVVDENRRVDVPRGKQHWHGQDTAIWYIPATGIWQPVWLEPLSKTHLDDLVVDSDITTGTLHLDAIVTAGQGAIVEVTASFDGAKVAWGAAEVDLRGHARLSLGLSEQQTQVNGDDVIDSGGVRLWSPERPNLYQLEVIVRRDGAELDRVSSHAGVRTIEVIDGKIRLNKRSYEQRLVLDQAYWPNTGQTAPDAAALVRDIELAKELGFNGARKHQKIEDPRFHYAADVLGFLIWDEVPSAYAFSSTSIAELSRDLGEMIRRDRSHPSVVAWVPMNESWGTPDLTNKQQQSLQAALYDLAHALDGTRPVIGNDGWEMVVSDIVAIHDYRNPEPIAAGYLTPEQAEAQDPAGRRFFVGDRINRQGPWMLTEFGGLALSKDDGWGYHKVTNGDELLAQVTALIDAIRVSGQYQGYCYTQLTDVGTELNGLLTLDRQHKLDAAKLAEVQQRPRR